MGSWGCVGLMFCCGYWVITRIGKILLPATTKIKPYMWDLTSLSFDQSSVKSDRKRQKELEDIFCQFNCFMQSHKV